MYTTAAPSRNVASDHLQLYDHCWTADGARALVSRMQLQTLRYTMTDVRYITG